MAGTRHTAHIVAFDCVFGGEREGTKISRKSARFSAFRFLLTSRTQHVCDWLWQQNAHINLISFYFEKTLILMHFTVYEWMSRWHARTAERTPKTVCCGCVCVSDGKHWHSWMEVKHMRPWCEWTKGIFNTPNVAGVLCAIVHTVVSSVPCPTTSTTKSTGINNKHRHYDARSPPSDNSTL